ncbi:MAG TPA: VCBS repeat-containing protein, partial [Chryseosolibacter sp.]|nr:VCBS repeat-containing protein [Chryseosolibacter sp.]
MKRLIALVLLPLFFSCSKPTRFERLSADETGIDFVNEVIEKDSFNILHDEYMYNGGGVGIADLDRNGYADVIFTANKVTPRIYLNKGDFRFEDITSSFEGLDASQWYSGVSIVDINSDGWPDVYFTSTSSKHPEKRRNKLWVNQGKIEDGKVAFKEQAAQHGIADTSYSVHAGFVDYDLDGDLDMYILNNIVNNTVPTNYRPKITDGT